MSFSREGWDGLAQQPQQARQIVALTHRATVKIRLLKGPLRGVGFIGFQVYGLGFRNL